MNSYGVICVCPIVVYEGSFYRDSLNRDFTVSAKDKPCLKKGRLCFSNSDKTDDFLVLLTFFCTPLRYKLKS
jgi:hypothetical protein